MAGRPKNLFLFVASGTDLTKQNYTRKLQACASAITSQVHENVLK
jgi:predicted ArsR family transcriptional regulator